MSLRDLSTNDTRHARTPSPGPNYEAKVKRAQADNNPLKPSKPAPKRKAKGSGCGSSKTRYGEYQVRRLLPAEIIKIALKEYSTRAKRQEALDTPSTEFDSEDELLEKVDLNSLKKAVQDTVQEMADDEILRPILKAQLLEQLVLKATTDMIKNEEFRERVERAYQKRVKMLADNKKLEAAKQSGHKPTAKKKAVFGTSHRQIPTSRKTGLSSSHKRVVMHRSPVTAVPKPKTVH